MTEDSDVYCLKYGTLKLRLRRSVPADYWCFEGIFFAGEYGEVKIGKDDIVLDVGSNIGMSLLYFYHKGARHLIGIEPERANFGMLKLNTAELHENRIEVLNLATSEAAETLFIQETGGTAITRRSGRGYPVKAETLDSILSSLGDPKVTVLKMDIEGYEERTLRNFTKYHDINQIIVETHGKELSQQVESILKGWGLVVRDVSRVSRSRVFVNVLSHPIAFLKAEMNNGWSTTEKVFRFMFAGGLSPVSADNPTSQQRVLYGYR
jgi:FkbM family methyltransferase